MAPPYAVKRKYFYCDFTETPGTPVFATTTNAIATAADNQVDYTYIDGQLMDWIQTGANTALVPIIQTAAPFGWAMPLDADSADSLEIGCGALVSGNTPYMSFTVGTDPAFFVRARMSFLGNVDNVAVATVGFRDSASQVDVTSAADLLTAYTHSAYLGVSSNAGVIKSDTQKSATTASTTATFAATTTALTATTGVDLKLLVSAAGVVTYQIDGAADVLLAGASYTFTNGQILVPAIHLVSRNGTGAQGSQVVLQEFECGHQ